MCRSCTKRSCDIIFMKMKVIWFCLQKTISGSYLKQNNSDLVFQIRTIFLKIMSMFVAGHVTRMWYLKHYGLCGSKNYPYLPYGRDFSLDPPPLWKFQSSFIHLLTFLGLWEPPPPPGISNPFCGGSVDIFRNYTLPLSEQNFLLKLQGNCWKDNVVTFSAHLSITI